jgi:hypothetical protein
MQCLVGDDDMMTDTMTTIALCVILVALVALIPIGCVMTRPKKETPPQKDDIIKPAA